MKHTKIKSLLLGLGLSGLLATGVSANTIILGNVGQVLAGGGSDWTYNIAYVNSRLVSGDFFTIVDFGAASIITPPTAPAGGAWVYSQAAVGSSPYLPGTIPDHPVELNATFTWVGATVSVGTASGGTFTLHSPIPSTTPIIHDYVRLDHANAGLTAGLLSRGNGPIGTPVEVSVPDGGTTLMMLGSAFAALGALRRILKS